MGGKYLSEESKKEIREQRRKYSLATAAVVRAAIGLVIAAIILLNLFTHVLQIVRYNGAGMEPALKNGQVLFLRKTQKVEAGDIIAFYYNNQVLVRRVIAVGGEQIRIENSGAVYVNDQELQEPYLTEKSIGQCSISFPCYIQNNCVFVMGDNRAVAMDSRLEEIGPVPLSRVIGTVILAI